MPKVDGDGSIYFIFKFSRCHMSFLWSPIVSSFHSAMDITKFRPFLSYFIYGNIYQYLSLRQPSTNNYITVRMAPHSVNLPHLLSHISNSWLWDKVFLRIFECVIVDHLISLAKCWKIWRKKKTIQTHQLKWNTIIKEHFFKKSFIVVFKVICLEESKKRFASLLK